MLTIIDEFSRSLAIVLARRLNSDDVLAALTELFVEHGSAAFIRSDNGGEFTAAAVREWLARIRVKTLYIEPGSPWGERLGRVLPQREAVPCLFMDQVRIFNCGRCAFAQRRNRICRRAGAVQPEPHARTKPPEAAASAARSVRHAARCAHAILPTVEPASFNGEVTRR